jgi:hypothetical protein
MVNTHPAGLHTACWFRSELLHPHRPREAALAPPCRRFKKPILLRAHLHLCRAAMPVEAVRHAVERLKHRGRRLDASASSSASRVGGGALREGTHPATQHVCESRETERDGERAAHRLGGVQLATVARELPSQGGHWQSPFTPCSCTCLPSQGGHWQSPFTPCSCTCLPSQGGHWQSPFTPCSCTCLPPAAALLPAAAPRAPPPPSPLCGVRDRAACRVSDGVGSVASPSCALSARVRNLRAADTTAR